MHARIGGDVHYPSEALGEHRHDGRACKSESAGEVDVQHALPVVVGHLPQHPVTKNASVVDQDVQRASLLNYLIDDLAG